MLGRRRRAGDGLFLVLLLSIGGLLVGVHIALGRVGGLVGVCVRGLGLLSLDRVARGRVDSAGSTTGSSNGRRAAVVLHLRRGLGLGATTDAVLDVGSSAAGVVVVQERNDEEGQRDGEEHPLEGAKGRRGLEAVEGVLVVAGQRVEQAGAQEVLEAADGGGLAGEDGPGAEPEDVEEDFKGAGPVREKKGA